MIAMTLMTDEKCPFKLMRSDFIVFSEKKTGARARPGPMGAPSMVPLTKTNGDKKARSKINYDKRKFLSISNECVLDGSVTKYSTTVYTGYVLFL